MEINSHENKYDGEVIMSAIGTLKFLEKISSTKKGFVPPVMTQVFEKKAAIETEAEAKRIAGIRARQVAKEQEALPITLAKSIFPPIGIFFPHLVLIV